MTLGRAPNPTGKRLFFQNFFCSLRDGKYNALYELLLTAALSLNIIAAGAAENVGGVQIPNCRNQYLDLSSFRARNNGNVHMVVGFVLSQLSIARRELYGVPKSHNRPIY